MTFVRRRLFVDTSVCATSMGVCLLGEGTPLCNSVVAALSQVRLLRPPAATHVWHGLLQRFASAEHNRIWGVGERVMGGARLFQT
jgi:hypothetical protein